MTTRANQPHRVKARRIGALERLTAQLKRGTKRVDNEEVKLSDSDRARIEQNIATLQART